MTIVVGLLERSEEFPSADDFQVVEGGILVTSQSSVLAFFPNGHFRYVRQRDEP